MTLPSRIGLQCTYLNTPTQDSYSSVTEPLLPYTWFHCGCRRMAKMCWVYRKLIWRAGPAQNSEIAGAWPHRRSRGGMEPMDTSWKVSVPYFGFQRSRPAERRRCARTHELLKFFAGCGVEKICGDEACAPASCGFVLPMVPRSTTLRVSIILSKLERLVLVRGGKGSKRVSSLVQTSANFVHNLRACKRSTKDSSEDGMRIKPAQATVVLEVGQPAHVHLHFLELGVVPLYRKAQKASNNKQHTSRRKRKFERKAFPDEARPVAEGVAGEGRLKPVVPLERVGVDRAGLLARVLDDCAVGAVETRAHLRQELLTLAVLAHAEAPSVMT
eukprot:5468388-Pleurochrysis_carterae.AAC.13